jgi:hypothetical protein
LVWECIEAVRSRTLFANDANSADDQAFRWCVFVCPAVGIELPYAAIRHGIAESLSLLVGWAGAKPAVS